MQVEFTCGHVMKSVGILSMAISAHLFHHPKDTDLDRKCIEDCKEELAKL